LRFSPVVSNCPTDYAEPATPGNATQYRVPLPTPVFRMAPRATRPVNSRPAVAGGAPVTAWYFPADIPPRPNGPTSLSPGQRPG
jgi:hypothetical protein